MTDTTTTDITTTVDTWLEAYAEPDAGRRADLVAAVWADDGYLADPPFDARGTGAPGEAPSAPCQDRGGLGDTVRH